MSCYKLHLAVWNGMEEYEKVDIQVKIEQWKKSITSDSKLLKAEIATVLYVAKNIQLGKAVLLPDVAAYFLDNYCGIGEWSTEELILIEMEDSEVEFTNKKHLLIHMQPYVEHKCAVRKIGTVIYPRNADLLTCLSWALQNNKQVLVDNTVPEAVPEAAVLFSAGKIINKKLQAGIQKTFEYPKEPKDVDIDAFIKSCDPLLWDFINTITESNREAEGREYCEIYEDTKKIRRFFIICVLMYTIQPSIKSPIHIALTDAVEVCGGLEVLIKILNRLGVTVSTVAHQTFVTSIAELERGKDIWETLQHFIFTCSQR